jgi:hypothetical protein
MTCESLPKSPPLVNTRRTNGPIVFFRVLAFTLPMDFELKWVEDIQIGILTSGATLLGSPLLLPNCRIFYNNVTVCISSQSCMSKSAQALRYL